MRITKQQSYLVLRPPTDSGASSTVSLLPDLTAAIRGWGPGTRISPVYGLGDVRSASPAQYSFPRKSVLYFLGPVSPFDISACLNTLKNASRVWITLGAFNFILGTSSQGDQKLIAKWLKITRCRWERWGIDSGKIVGADYSAPPESRTSSSWRETLASLEPIANRPEFAHSIDEYRALMASSISRAYVVFPPMARDLERANDKVATRILGTSESTEPNTIALLIDVNAALSRLASQAFSGASPIQQTECHFWTHSLLGTGIPNIALANIRAFLQGTLGAARIPERVSRYRTIQTGVPNLAEQPFTSNDWRKKWINEVGEIQDGKPLFPQITYFSGRDGFRTTETTLSAPLSAITSCNSRRWSLMTVTHEASHTIVGGALSVILPDFNNDDEVRMTAQLLNGTPPSNLLEELRRFLIRIMVELDQVAGQEPPDEMTAFDVTALVKTWKEEIEEIMVHVFDFLFFYGQRVQHYVSSIWYSWDSIPHLKSKIHEYIVRTLCAAAVSHLDSDGTMLKAREDVLGALEPVAQHLGVHSYVNLALKELTSDWHLDSSQSTSNQKQFSVRLSLVAFVRTFFHSPELVQSVRGQAAKGRPQQKPRVSPLVRLDFSGERVENPLRFIEDVVGLEASTSDSAWILQRLAFDMESDAY